VSTAVEDRDFDRALELRGPEYLEMLAAFQAVSCFPEASAHLPAKKRMRIGIVQQVYLTVHEEIFLMNAIASVLQQVE
jgi:hypothetical protein